MESSVSLLVATGGWGKPGDLGRVDQPQSSDSVERWAFVGQTVGGGRLGRPRQCCEGTCYQGYSAMVSESLQVWQCIPVTLALGRLRQEDLGLRGQT